MEWKVSNFEHKNFYRLFKGAVYFSRATSWKKISKLEEKRCLDFQHKKQCWQKCIVLVQRNSFDVVFQKPFVSLDTFSANEQKIFKKSSKNFCAGLLKLHSARWGEKFHVEDFSESLIIYEFSSALEAKSFNRIRKSA